MRKLQYYLKNTLQYLSLLCFLGILGCNSGSQDSSTTTVQPENTVSYSVQPDKATQQSLPALVKDMKYIQLQLPNKMYLREVRKVLFDNSSIFLFETSVTGDNPKIYSFDHSGRFDFLIEKPGRGPGEFETVYDFDVTEEFIVLSTPTELKFYDKNSSQYIRSIDKPASNMQMIRMLNEYTVATDAGRYRSNRSRNQVKIYDLNKGNIISEDVSFNNHALKLGHSYRYFFNLNDTTSIIPMYDQTVFRIIPESNQYSLKPIYRLDFGQYWINDELLADSYDNRGRFFNSSDDYVHTVDVFETEDIIYTYYHLENNDYSFIYDKKSGETLNISDYTENNIGWIGKPEAVYENWIVNLVSPFEIEEANIQSNEALKEILDNSHDKGHPFLIFAQF